MSFILDALKKSETDRQRQSGPALYEVKLATPRTQLPLWAICLGVVLVANLALVMWVLFRGRSHEGAAQAATTGQTYAAPTAGVPPSGAVQPGAAVQPGSAQPPPQYAPNNQGYAPNAQSYPPNAQVYAPNGPAPGPQPQPPSQQPLPAQAAPAQTADAAAQNSNADDYAPATEPTNSSGFHVRRATESGLQLYSDAAANGGLPDLRVDMHTYAPRPQDRFVLINMKKAREGDMVADGVRVESITPDGVVVSHNGAQFLLPK